MSDQRATQHEPVQPRLHMLNKPPAHHRFPDCLNALAAGDTLLLIEDAVLAAIIPNLRLPEGTRACIADLQARGLTGQPLADGVVLADYDDIAILTAEHRLSISW